MDFILQQITDWLKEMLISAIMGNLSGMFESVNNQVGEIATFKWVFKTFVAVMLITNTFNITMAVFDVAQHVVNASGGIIAGNTAIDASGLEALEETLQGMDLGPLIGLLLQSFVVQITMSALAIIIFVIVYILTVTDPFFAFYLRWSTN